MTKVLIDAKFVDESKVKLAQSIHTKIRATEFGTNGWMLYLEVRDATEGDDPIERGHHVQHVVSCVRAVLEERGVYT